MGRVEEKMLRKAVEEKKCVLDGHLYHISFSRSSKTVYLSPDKDGSVADNSYLHGKPADRYYYFNGGEVFQKACDTAGKISDFYYGNYKVMQNRSYLKTVKKLHKEIDQLELERIEIEEKFKKCKKDAHRDSKDISSCVRRRDITITLLQQKADKLTDQLIDTKEEIVVTIKDMFGPTHRKILMLKYIDFLPWNKVADALGLPLKRIHELHKEALLRLNAPVLRRKKAYNFSKRRKNGIQNLQTSKRKI